MPITVTSTTDTPETVASLGDLSVDVKEEKSAPATDVVDETAEESDASENEESDAGESQPEDKPKKKGGFKKKIGKLIGKLSQAEQEREYWRGEALKHQNSAEKQLDKKAAPEGKPKVDAFDSHDAYVEALTDWKLEQKLSAERAKTKESELKTEHQKRVETHVTRVKEFAKDHSDFEEMIEDVDDIPMSLTVQEVILASENGPELMYELAKNKEEYKRICALPAIAAARELGRFESRIEKSDSLKEKPEPKTTKAPPPIKPIGSNAKSSIKKSLDDPNLTQREFEKLREEQIAKRMA